MHYLGFSRGSQLGNQYADLFLDGFRALAIDGNFNHSQMQANKVANENAAAQDISRQFAFWWST